MATQTEPPLLPTSPPSWVVTVLSTAVVVGLTSTSSNVPSAFATETYRLPSGPNAAPRIPDAAGSMLEFRPAERHGRRREARHVEGWRGLARVVVEEAGLSGDLPRRRGVGEDLVVSDRVVGR